MPVRSIRLCAVAGVSAAASLALLASLSPTGPALAADPPADLYEGHVQVVRGAADDPDILKGQVFDDVNENSELDGDERGIAGVSVSNGVDVVTTDGQGTYELPVRDNMTAFVTQPAGWQVPVDEHSFAQFSYNHLPEGSPELEYGGIEPTGPVPKAVNFPMVESRATASSQQNCPLAADTQAYDAKEMGYARDGAVADLADRTDYAGCGILLLGDNVGDDLSLNDDLKDIYRHSNGPVRAAPGNHDIDFDATNDAHSLDTFRQQFGPANFSYDVGKTHFVVLDSIDYSGDPDSRSYREYIGEDQLEWLENDLQNVPRNAQVVIATHAPVLTHREVVVDNARELYDAIADYPNAVTVGGHTHTLENLRAGESREEWKAAGIGELSHTQLVAGAVSGDWYSGGLNSDGLPYAFTSDAAEPGVMTLEFDGADMAERYTVRGESDDHQLLLGVNSPAWREWAQHAREFQEGDEEGPAPEDVDPRTVTEADVRGGDTWLTTSFLSGSSDANVEVSVDGKRPEVAEHTQPGTGESLNKGWEYTDTVSATHNLLNSGNVGQSSSHLWRAPLPADLDPGTHRAEVTATDRYGREFTETVRFTVVEGEELTTPSAPLGEAEESDGRDEPVQSPDDRGEPEIPTGVPSEEASEGPSSEAPDDSEDDREAPDDDEGGFGLGG